MYNELIRPFKVEGGLLKPAHHGTIRPEECYSILHAGAASQDMQPDMWVTAFYLKLAIYYIYFASSFVVSKVVDGKLLSETYVCVTFSSGELLLCEEWWLWAQVCWSGAQAVQVWMSQQLPAQKSRQTQWTWVHTYMPSMNSWFYCSDIFIVM